MRLDYSERFRELFYRFQRITPEAGFVVSEMEDDGKSIDEIENHFYRLFPKVVINYYNRANPIVIRDVKDLVAAGMPPARIEGVLLDSGVNETLAAQIYIAASFMKVLPFEMSN